MSSLASHYDARRKRFDRTYSWLREHSWRAENARLSPYADPETLAILLAFVARATREDDEAFRALRWETEAPGAQRCPDCGHRPELQRDHGETIDCHRCYDCDGDWQSWHRVTRDSVAEAVEAWNEAVEEAIAEAQS